LLGFDEAESISGYPPGGTPSVHHKNQLQVVIDRELLTGETIFCGGGARNRLLELRTTDVLRLTNALVGSISQ
jgi:prolyl-tRNA editing enzyme YbaK/EbsC (Cys-tRNA(Pro) deacylase)